jgi:hypothetical protein
LIGVLAFSGLTAQAQQPAPGVPATNGPGCGTAAPRCATPISRFPKALTSKQKFARFAHNSLSPYRWALAAAQAGVEQSSDSIPGYGQGAAGFGKRFRASLAGQSSNEFFGTFLFPTLFHQDPRYFPKGQGSKSERIEYAVSRTFITRTDSGGPQFNGSKLLGALVSAAIANAYYPQEERTVGHTFARFGVQLGGNAGFNVVKEFLPALRKRFWPRHRVQETPTNTVESGNGTHF